MVPRGVAQVRSALAAEAKQVVGTEGRQLVRPHSVASADEEVAQVVPVVHDRGLGESTVVSEEPAIAFDQLVIRRLVGHDSGEGSFLPKHRKQVCEADPHRHSLAPRRMAVTATDWQVIANELLDHRLVRCPGNTSFVKDPSQVDNRVPVVATGPFRIPTFA